MSAKKHKTEADVLTHHLVPKHTKMTEEEIKKLLDQYNITLDQLPRIKVTDPSIQHLDAEERDVIRITRPSPTVGTTDYFRVVVQVK